MVDKLIIKDVQLTAANDDNYFVFEDFILQVRVHTYQGNPIFWRIPQSPFLESLGYVCVALKRIWLRGVIFRSGLIVL